MKFLGVCAHAVSVGGKLSALSSVGCWHNAQRTGGTPAPNMVSAACKPPPCSAAQSRTTSAGAGLSLSKHMRLRFCSPLQRASLRSDSKSAVGVGAVTAAATGACVDRRVGKPRSSRLLCDHLLVGTCPPWHALTGNCVLTHCQSYHRSGKQRAGTAHGLMLGRTALQVAIAHAMNRLALGGTYGGCASSLLWRALH